MASDCVSVNTCSILQLCSYSYLCVHSVHRQVATCSVTYICMRDFSGRLDKQCIIICKIKVADLRECLHLKQKCFDRRSIAQNNTDQLQIQYNLANSAYSFLLNEAVHA